MSEPAIVTLGGIVLPLVEAAGLEFTLDAWMIRERSAAALDSPSADCARGFEAESACADSRTDDSLRGPMTAW
jgi:hypothetical protein